MLTVRDLSFFRVGRLSSTSISSTMLSSWVFCLFRLDVFGSFSSISVSAKYLVYYYLFDNFYFNKSDIFKFTRMLKSEQVIIYTSVPILLGMKEVFLVIFVFSVAFLSIFAFWF